MIKLRRAQEMDLQNHKRILKKMKRLIKELKSGSSEANPSVSSVSIPPRPSVSNPSASPVSNPSRSSVSNPSGPSTSKKLRAETVDRNRYNQSAKENVSEDGKDVALKSRDRSDERAREVMRKLFEERLLPSVFRPSVSSVSKPSRSSVSNPSGPSTSKKFRAETVDRNRYNQSAKENVSEDGGDVALKSRDRSDAKAREVMRKLFEENLLPSVFRPSVSSVSKPSRSSVSNPSEPSTSKKFKVENTDPTRYNQSVAENVSDDGEDVALKLKDRNRKAMMKMLIEDDLRPSISNPSRSSVSNPPRCSISNPSRSSVSNPPRCSISNPSRSLEVEEDITENEETNSEHVEFNSSDDDVWVPIGIGKTLVRRDQYRKVNWRSYTIATRTLLLAVFPRRVLATHSLTGKKSPAFQDKPAKLCLDPTKIADVIWTIMDKFKVEKSLVRNIITIKCADECKMWKARCRNNKNVPLT